MLALELVISQKYISLYVNPLRPNSTKLLILAKTLVSEYEGIIKNISYEHCIHEFAYDKRLFFYYV